jgi:hypothetical protein
MTVGCGEEETCTESMDLKVTPRHRLSNWWFMSRSRLAVMMKIIPNVSYFSKQAKSGYPATKLSMS